MIAFVRGVMAAAIRAGSMLNVVGSMSTYTGFAPRMAMVSAVATNVNGVVITSSPGPMPRAIIAIWRASVPDAHPTAYFTPRYPATAHSNSPTSFP